jgi:hypothetical protein
MQSLVELIVNLLQLPKAYEWFKENFGDYDWCPTLIALGIISIVVAAVALVLMLLL